MPGQSPTAPAPSHSCILIHHREPERPRAVAAGTLVCPAHLRQLERMIAEAPALDEELVAAHTASNAAGGERVSSSTTPGLKMREDAIAVRTELRRILILWAGDVAAARRFTRPPAGAPLTAIATFLIRNLTWIAGNTHPDALTYNVERLADARRHARRIVQPGAKPHTVDVAPCVEAQSCNVDTRELEPCPGVLQVTFWPEQAGRDVEPPVIWCPACGATYAALSWYRLGQRALAAAGR